MQGIRKSLKEKKSPHTSISSPISNNIKQSSVSSINDIQLSQSNILQSPKIVIKALYDYKPQGPGELEFHKGDFFHVIGNENDPEWYEACNPPKNIRGMVPVPYFEVFGKTTRTVSGSSYSGSGSNTTPSSRKLSVGSNIRTSRPGSTSQGNTNTLYAIVLYEFKAERSDELDIHIGENIILCAHHNYEWFIAKPIDRLGGPGLVPVSYVSVINILSGQSTGNDVVDDINAANLPTVEDWKNKNAKYKASSIPLGNVDENEPKSNFRDSSVNRQLAREESVISQVSRHSYTSPPTDIAVNESTPYVYETTVDSFHVDNGRYWFQVHAKISNGEVRLLCRYYEDFYDFQIRLLELFPNEAGRANDHKRILPFIPGPLTYVTDKITKKRQNDLNDYVKELIELPSYISHSNFVKSLFELRHDFDHTEQQRGSYNAQHHHEEEEEEEEGPLNGIGESTLVKEESTTTLNKSAEQPLQSKPAKKSQNSESIKLKFYYRDDIFALLIPTDIDILELRKKISQRIYDVDEDKDFKIFVKGDGGVEILSNSELSVVLKDKLKILIEDDE
jgi:bud emergence protein 1